MDDWEVLAPAYSHAVRAKEDRPYDDVLTGGSAPFGKLSERSGRSPPDSLGFSRSDRSPGRRIPGAWASPQQPIPEDSPTLRIELARARAEVQALRREKTRLKRRLELLIRSASWRITAPVRLAGECWGNLRRRLALLGTHNSNSRPSGGALSPESDRNTPPNPLCRVSVVTPVMDPDPQALAVCIESVLAQDHNNWELCLADCGSADAGIRELLASSGAEARICVVPAHGLGAAAAANLAAESATGEFLAFLPADGRLAPAALEAVARAAGSEDVDLLYTDEDWLDEDGTSRDPCFKPAWSPEHLLSMMYLGRLLVIRKALFLQLGGFRAGYEGAEDYDLVLRASRQARTVRHVTGVLCHGCGPAEPSEADRLDAARAALADHVKHLWAEARVEDGLLLGTFRVRPPIPDGTPVTLLVITYDSNRVMEDGRQINLVRHAIQSIRARSTYPHYRLLVVDSGNASAETKQVIERAGGRLVSYRPIEGPFNFPDKLNFAMTHVDTEQVILLNDDVEVIAPGWIEALLEWSCQPEVGAVGARLLYPNGTLQHAGVALFKVGRPSHVFSHFPGDQVGYGGSTHVVRNFSAVTGAVLAFRRSVFQELHGFDTRLAQDFNDTDFCLRLRAAGYRIVFTPYCELYHLESSTRPKATESPADNVVFEERWKAIRGRSDAFINFEAISALPSADI